MGKNTKRVAAWIEDIKDDKFTAFPSKTSNIYKDTNFRLDMQGVCNKLFLRSALTPSVKDCACCACSLTSPEYMTSGTPKNYNLQVQINNETTITSLKKMAPQTVTFALVPEDMSMTPRQIKDALIADIRV
jgi:hypothetical protein